MPNPSLERSHFGPRALRLVHVERVAAGAEGSDPDISVGEDGGVSIVIGDDDETWGIGISISARVFESIIGAVEACSGGPGVGFPSSAHIKRD